MKERLKGGLAVGDCDPRTISAAEGQVPAAMTALRDLWTNPKEVIGSVGEGSGALGNGMPGPPSLPPLPITRTINKVS